MNKGLILTFSVQKNNSIQYTMQDQLYLPRLKNYLNIEYDEFVWEEKARFELSKEAVQQYQAIAYTPLTEKYLPKLIEWNPDMKVIKIPTEEFLHSFAPRGFVMGMTSGYLVADAPGVAIQGSPVGVPATVYSEQDLRKLMRAYPHIYWEVTSFEALKEKLTEKSADVTVALTPASLPYKKFLINQFPTVPIIDTKDIVDPLDTFGNPMKDELLMIAIGSVTALILSLLVFFQ